MKYRLENEYVSEYGAKHSDQIRHGSFTAVLLNTNNL